MSKTDTEIIHTKCQLPYWLQQIQKLNDNYNKVIYIGQIIKIIVNYHCLKRGWVIND